MRGAPVVPLQHQSPRRRRRRLLHEEHLRCLRGRWKQHQRFAASPRRKRRIPLPPPHSGVPMTRVIDHRTALSRRRLLGGMGALTVALTSPVWRSATVFGQDASAKPTRRFIGLFSANGTIASEFFPTGPTGTALSAANLGRILAPMAA